MYHFILVHGTFAEHAPWTLDGSALHVRVASLFKSGERPNFTSVPWGGRNLMRARMVAANAIANEVRAKSMVGNEKIFLIGHSHGGSAIAYFLKTYPQLRERVTGVAFLSTPFIATRLRPQWRLFLRALLISSAIMLALSIFFAVTWADWYIRVSYGFSEIVSEFLYYPVTLALGLLLGFFAWRRTERVVSTYLEKILPDELDQLATVNMPRGNHLYVRAMGDEAASLLSMAQILSWIASVVGAIASLPIEVLGNLWRKLTSNFLGKIIAAVGVFLFAAWICTRFAMTNIEFTFCRMALFGPPKNCSVFSSLHHWLIPEHLVLTGYSQWKWLFEPIDNVLFLLSPLFIVITVVIVCYSVLTTLLVSVSAVMLILFGWVGFGPALFADLAVEPTPGGPITLVHVDWQVEQTESILALNHSRTYANPYALDQLAEWISPQLSRETK